MIAPLLEHVQADLGGALIVTASILLVLLVAELWKRSGTVPVEWTRKLAHVGAGAVLLPVPWLLQHRETVFLLSAGFCALLWLLKRTGTLTSVHGIRRVSAGAFLFPAAVFEAFSSSGGDPTRYAVPLAVLALADSAAAIVGERHGTRPWFVLGCRRTAQGSAAFFVVAFLCVVVGLSVGGVSDWASRALIALVVAVLVTAVEALAVHGTDNLLVPFATGVALDRLLPLEVPALARLVLGIALVLCVGAAALAWHRAPRLAPQ